MPNAALKPILNSSNATPPGPRNTLTPETVTAGPVKAATHDAPLCSKCHRSLSPGTRYKWREVCRQKDREKARRKKQRALERAAQAYASQVPAAIAPDTRRARTKLHGVDMDVEMRLPDGSGAVHLPTKRKVSEAESDGGLLEAEPTHSTSTEYQTEQLFLDALSERIQRSLASSSSTTSSSAPSYVNFHGSYAIVMDPDVSAARRAKRVKSDLVKATGLKFGYVCLLSHLPPIRGIPAARRTRFCSDSSKFHGSKMLWGGPPSTAAVSITYPYLD